MVLFKLNTFQDRNILRKMHPTFPESLAAQAPELSQIKDSLVAGSGHVHLHGGELSTALNFIHWPAFGTTDGDGAGQENQLGAQSKSVFLAPTENVPLWSEAWKWNYAHTYATSSVLYHDRDADLRPEIEKRVDSFKSGDVSWHTPAFDFGTVMEAAEVLDKIQIPVYQPMSMEAARAEHKTMVTCFEQVQDMVWRQRIDHTPPDTGHVRAYVLCQTWEMHNGSPRWTKKPFNLLSKLKGHKSGKEGSPEIAVPADKCIPVAIMVTYNEPVYMGNQGTETILALTRASSATMNAAIAESVSRRRSPPDQFEAPQFPIFTRPPLTRPVRLGKWVDTPSAGPAAVTLEY